MMVYLVNSVLPAMRNWFYAEDDGDPKYADAVKAFYIHRLRAMPTFLELNAREGLTEWMNP